MRCAETAPDGSQVAAPQMLKRKITALSFHAVCVQQKYHLNTIMDPMSFFDYMLGAQILSFCQGEARVLEMMEATI